MSPSCVFRAYNAPYNAFNGVLNVTRTFAETLQGTLSPSAALYRKSADEYLLNSVDFVEQYYSKNCGFISSFGLGFLPFLPSVDSCGRYRQ